MDDELEGAARRTAELFVAIYRGLEDRPIAPAITREALRKLLEGRLSEEGIGIAGALGDFERLVLPHSMGIAHPAYMGLVNCSPLPAGPLADLLVSALNNNAGAFSQSPAATTCEHEVVAAFCDLLRLPAGADGLFLPGGTFATLQAIVLARTRVFGSRAPEEARLYTSEAAHFSVARSARVAGLGDDQIVVVPVRGRGEMDVDLLRQAVAADRRRGRAPFAIVATAGTTGTGAIDPLEDIAEVARRESLWLHVDACYGGAALLLPELRGRFAGIERSDSVAVDAHKWFFLPLTAGLLLTIHPECGERAFFTEAGSYIPEDGEREAWRWGIPTSRRASGLAVWLTLRAHGFVTIRRAVRNDIALMRSLEERLRKRGFEVLEGGELSIACARAVVSGIEGTASDRVQARIAAEVSASGRAWFSTVRHAGRTWLRFNLVNLHTRGEHVARLAELVEAVAGSVAARES